MQSIKKARRAVKERSKGGYNGQRKGKGEQKREMSPAKDDERGQPDTKEVSVKCPS